MPYPVQITAEDVIAAARKLIEQEGLDQLALARLATALGVKAPSLYRLFPSKSALLRAINETTLHDLAAAMNEGIAQAGDNPEAKIMGMAAAYRAFALRFPAAYGLLFATTIAEVRGDPEMAEAVALPLQAIMAQIAGPEQALTALRGAWALAHGFIMLELNGQFQRGGDLEAAYLHAVQVYAAGWRERRLGR
jgi:AcrR family transcriptional regulator